MAHTHAAQVIHDSPRMARAELRHGAMLFDPAAVAAPSADLLRPHSYEGDPAGVSGRGGRGAVWYVRGPFGEGVLRHYRRGGAVARVNRDLYLFHGEARTRPFREFVLLQALHARGLPVPRPFAAGYTRLGAFYRADILIQRIADAETLAERLHRGPLSAALWWRIGETLARFHAEGAFHADLNAHNVLLGAGAAHGGEHGGPDFASSAVVPEVRHGQTSIWLIDFDRGGLRARGRWCEANLQRLCRSLRKLAAAHDRAFDVAGWGELLLGYRREAAA